MSLGIKWMPPFWFKTNIFVKILEKEWKEEVILGLWGTYSVTALTWNENVIRKLFKLRGGKIYHYNNIFNEFLLSH